MLIKKMKSLITDDSGVVMVLVAMGLVALLGCMALVIDAGMLYADRSKASNAIDAAVLAGARELPDHPDKAEAVALDYAQKNGLEADEVSFELGDYNTDEIPKPTSIKGVVTNRHMGTFFARVLGIDSWDVPASAKARVGPVGGFDGGEGVIPIGVDKQYYAPGTSMILKYGGGDGDTGWFGYVDIDGQQVKVLADGIEFGSDTPVDVTEEDEEGLPVVTGVKNADAICEAVQTRIEYVCDHADVDECIAAGCYHIVIVPVGEETGDPGGTATFRVSGFAAFYLEAQWEEDKQQVIRGTFVKMVSSGHVDDTATDFGLYAVELCE